MSVPGCAEWGPHLSHFFSNGGGGCRRGEEHLHCETRLCAARAHKPVIEAWLRSAQTNYIMSLVIIPLLKIPCCKQVLFKNYICGTRVVECYPNYWDHHIILKKKLTVIVFKGPFVAVYCELLCSYTIFHRCIDLNVYKETASCSFFFSFSFSLNFFFN